MAMKWAPGILAAIFLGAAGAGVWSNHSIESGAKASVENAGYKDVAVSATFFNTGCNIWRERYPYRFTAQTKDGAPASGKVCVTGVFDRTMRIIPDKPAR